MDVLIIQGAEPSHGFIPSLPKSAEVEVTEHSGAILGDHRKLHCKSDTPIPISYF
jgi:hypothetical protein